jgi:acyl carrier protein
MRGEYLENDVKIETREQATRQLFELVAHALKVEPSSITLDSGPLVLPEWDSFSHLHVVVAIEDKYGIMFDPDAIAAMITVRDILAALRDKGVVEK